MNMLLLDYVILSAWISTVLSLNQTYKSDPRTGRDVLTGADLQGACQGSVEIRHFGTKQIIHKHITKSRVLSLQKDEKWEIRKIGNCCHNLHTKKKCRGYFYRIGNQWSQIAPRWDELTLVTLNPGSSSSCNSISRRKSRLGCPVDINLPLKIYNNQTQTLATKITSLSTTTTTATTKTKTTTATTTIARTTTTIITTNTSTKTTITTTTTSTITKTTTSSTTTTTTTTSTIITTISTTTTITTTTTSKITTTTSNTTITTMTTTTTTTTSTITTTTTTLSPFTTNKSNKKCQGFVEIRDYQTKKLIKSKVYFSQVLSIQKDRDRVLKSFEVRKSGNCCFNLHTREGCKGKFYRLKKAWTLISSNWEELTLVNIDPVNVKKGPGYNCKAISKRQSRKNCPITSSTTTKTLPITSTESSTNRTLTTNDEPSNPLINMVMQWSKNTMKLLRNIKVVP